MTDKEKIRAEIIRRMKGKCPIVCSYIIYDDILNFIDSMQEEPVSEELEKAIDKYLDNGLALQLDWKQCDIKFKASRLINFSNYIAQWQKQQDIKYGYITALQGEKRFARYILEMIANGWHIEAIKTACNDKIKEDEQ